MKNKLDQELLMSVSEREGERERERERRKDLMVINIIMKRG